MFNMSNTYNRLERPKPEELTPIGVRDVDAQVWREIKAEAFRQGVAIARLLEAIWAFWDEHPREVADWLLQPPPTKRAVHRTRYVQDRNQFFEQLARLNPDDERAITEERLAAEAPWPEY
jgi:hypothetical protein